jgi:hypothetical protein
MALNLLLLPMAIRENPKWSPTYPKASNLVCSNPVLVLWELLPEPFEVGEGSAPPMVGNGPAVPSKDSPAGTTTGARRTSALRGRVGDAWSDANGTPWGAEASQAERTDKKVAVFPTTQWPDAKDGVATEAVHDV